MYSNYNMNMGSSVSPYIMNRNSSTSSIPTVNQSKMPTYTNNDDRFIAGGFLGPFILGGITGGLLAPAFSNPGYGYGRPVYNNYYYPYPPYPYYGPYYR